MSFFSGEGMGQITNYNKFVQTHWIVSFKDALIVVALYLLVGVLVRNMSWGKKFNNKRLIILIILGALWAIAIEYHGINTHNWAYNSSMIVLPVLNVGILPVLQMMILPALSILFSRNGLRV